LQQEQRIGHPQNHPISTGRVMRNFPQKEPALCVVKRLRSPVAHNELPVIRPLLREYTPIKALGRKMGVFRDAPLPAGRLFCG
jgi:hypothetical protein